MKTRLLLFTLCLPILLIGQNGEWERFLPMTEINEIISDQDYLWIATNAGLIRMDAELYDKTYFDSENGLAGDEIHDILFDTEGKLWAATDAGLSVWENNQWRNLVVPEKYGSSTIYSMTLDWNGRIWAGMIDQLILIENDQLEVYENDGLDGRVDKLFAHDGALWMSLEGNLWKLKDGLMQKEIPFRENQLNDISIDKNGRLLVASYPYEDASASSLMRLNGNEWEAVLFSAISSDEVMQSLENSCRENLWVGSFSGNIYEIAPDGRRSVSIAGLDSAHYPTVIHHDRFRNKMWIASTAVRPWGGPDFYPLGLYEIENQTATYHSIARNGLPDINTIIDLFPDPDGSMWVIMHKHIMHYDKGSWQRWDLEKSISASTRDQQGRIWMGMQGTPYLQIFDQGKIKEAKVEVNGELQNIPPTTIRKISFSNDSSFYFSTSRSMIISAQLEEIQEESLVISLDTINSFPIPLERDNLIRNLYVSSDDNLWIVYGDNQVYRYDGTQWTGPANISLGAIYDISDSEGKIWFSGGERGLFPGGIGFTDDANWPNIVPFDLGDCQFEQGFAWNIVENSGNYYVAHRYGITIRDEQGNCTYVPKPSQTEFPVLSKLQLDAYGNVWTAAFREFYVYNPDQLIEVIQEPVAAPPMNFNFGEYSCVDPLDLDTWQIYPLPVSYGLWIERNFAVDTEVDVYLLDYMGRIVGQWENLDPGAGDYKKFLELGNIPAGNYLLQIVVNGANEVRKISLQTF